MLDGKIEATSRASFERKDDGEFERTGKYTYKATIDIRYDEEHGELVSGLISKVAEIYRELAGAKEGEDASP